MRTIGVLTGARSDYGGIRPVLKKIVADPELRLMLLVTGMHLSPEFGRTIDVIEADGFDIAERIEMLVASDTPQAISKSVGLGVMGFAQFFARSRPDIFLVLGDRFETLAAVVAALPFNIPVAHISGGEITAGAIDDAIRHAITKMSHLHFVGMEEYRERVIQMGEEPWRVTVTGEPGLDSLLETPAVERSELERFVDLPFEPRPLLVTFHPVTLIPGATSASIDALIAALDELQWPVVFTFPNADAEGRLIIERLQHFVSNHSDARIVVNAGSQRYFSMMKYCAAMVGNSSSGIIEAASFELPVVDIGDRQRGRCRAANVIHAEPVKADILKAVRQALSPPFRRSLQGMKNPYGDGYAAARIVKVLKNMDLTGLVNKRFHAGTNSLVAS